MVGIYTITNIINNKMYIGYSVCVQHRLNTHKCDLIYNKHDNDRLQKSWNKYGENNFKFELLEECENELLASQEHYWATILNTHDPKFGYNIRPTHPYNDYRHTKETKDKIGRGNKGKIYSDETRLKMSESKKMLIKEKGCYITSETRKKGVEASRNIKRIVSQKTKDKQSLSMKGKDVSPKPVLLLDKYGNILKEFPLQTEAAIYLGLSTSGVYKRLKNKIIFGDKNTIVYK